MIAFVHIEKCGGTTLIHMLRQSFFLNHCDVIPCDHSAMRFTGNDLRKLKRLRPALTSIAGHSIRYDAGLHHHCEVNYFTLLRDPIKRYLSDYQHLGKQFLLGKDSHFERWLELKSRHNYQTKSIAGEDNLSTAVDLLNNQFALVGLVEKYETFLLSLRELILEKHGRQLPLEGRPKNVRSGQSDVREEQALLLETYREQITEANQLDIELYEQIASKDAAPLLKNPAALPSLQGPFQEKMQATAAWLYRNVIYKPHTGRLPFAPHALPIYIEGQKAA